MARGGRRDGAALEYTLLGGRTLTAELATGESWTFGRDERCAAVLKLPTLSRLALSIQHAELGVCRVSSRQSGLGRILIDADDRPERHVVALGAGPVHLFAGNYTMKLELPPVVLRLHLAVPPRRSSAGRPPLSWSPPASASRTGAAWTPEDPGPDAPAWITVAALAVALDRYPELATSRARPSESLRRWCGRWCGHASSYWVNERLKEAVAAADLVVPEHGERLAAAVTHYGQVFPTPTIRRLRDALLEQRDAEP